jgi:hypothetical protein
MEQRKVRRSVHDTNLDGNGSTPAVVVHIRCLLRGDRRRVREARARRHFRRIRMRNEEAFLQFSRNFMFTHHERCQAHVHLSHLSRHTERTNLVSYVGILAGFHKQLHDRQMTSE